MNEPHDLPAPASMPVDERLNGQARLTARVQSLRLKAEGPAARPRSAWLPWGLTVIAVATAAAFGWRAYRLSPAEAVAAAEAPTAGNEGRAPGVVNTAAESATTSGEVVLDAKGYVIAAHQIQISPQVGGEIIWLDGNFKEGAVYQKLAQLARVDTVIYEAQVKSARANLSVAKVNLKQVETGSTLKEITAAKAQLKNLSHKVELSRIDERNKRQAGVGTSRDDMEKSVVQTMMDSAAQETQKETVDKLELLLDEQRQLCRAQVQKAEADLEQAEKNLRNCTILAPTTGLILTKKAELGGYVNPLAFGAAGYLCEMADLRDLEVELDIQERDIARVKQGQRCRIMPEAGQRDPDFLKTHPDGYAGVVSRRMPMANRSKGAITVRVKVEMPEKEEGGRYLLPDMGALVSFLKQ